MEALWVWRQFPRQIASDLSRFHRRRIAEWHRGDMSSYELLELLEFMPEHGAFKIAARGGEYSEQDQVWRHIANELGKLRAITQTVHSGKATDMRTFPTMAEMREATEDQDAADERREEFFQFADRSSREEIDA